MSNDTNSNNNAALAGHVVGTKDDDVMTDGYTDASGNEQGATDDGHDKVNGNSGSDIITTDEGSDLAAGDMVGDEWQFVDGKWVYDPAQIDTASAPVSREYDDIISTGAGDDVVLGNGGNDTIDSGSGNDTVNAGTGDDIVFGGDGDDLLNLEDGDDYAEGGRGDDTINGGDGDDVIYGDVNIGSLITEVEGTASLEEYATHGEWVFNSAEDYDEISHNVATELDEKFEISFELAANLAGGHGYGQVEVLWNGEVVGLVDTSTGIYEKHVFTVDGAADESNLSFRVLDPEPDPDAPVYDFSGAIVSYEKTMDFGDGDVTLDAFAPGQTNLYQVINGQLNVFDIETNSYVETEVNPGFKINGVGFNQDDDLIYGIAKGEGVDALGNPVAVSDIVVMDATGAAYRVGEGFYGDYVGDFDDAGNLWTFNASINRVSVVDVDNIGADGNPVIDHYDLPDDVFAGKIYDIAYNSADGNFYGVAPPSSNGGEGRVIKVDMSEVASGGDPIVQELPITGTLYDNQMADGMAKGAYGAVFLDGDGNLYYGLNNGDHDLGTMGVDDSSGAIYKVNMDWDNGAAYSEYMADAQSTGSNDGAVDPRSADAFDEASSEATVLLREITVKPNEGGNDDLRGGAGDDEIYGNEGDDILAGGEGDDMLSGDAGADKLRGGAGDDILKGGAGDDKLTDSGGSDNLDGGAGKDYVNAGSGDDQLAGGAGDDKLVGGTGSDVIEGGSGDDHMWGGNWWHDDASDTFVVSAGSGKDMIHDFEADKDLVDLSSYGIDYADLKAAMADKGWATEIDLSALTGGQSGDKLIIKSVDIDDLDETNFIL